MKPIHISGLSLVLFLALSSPVSAQNNNIPPTIAWQKTLGGSNTDVATCVRPTSDGGFIVAAASSSNDGDMTGNHGQDDFYLFKLSSSGTLIWQHSYGGTGSDQACGVVQTSDGGYAVAGKSGSHNGDVTGNHGSADYWIMKTNAQGTLQWQKSYGGSGADNANFMSATSDNGFVIVGTSYSNNGNVTGNHGNGDAWVIKLDQNGNLQWQKAVGGSQLEIASDVKQTNDGGYIVTGYSLSGDGDITHNYGEEDFLFFKLDANGNLAWLKTMGGTGGDCGSTGVQTIDGGYAICGLSHSHDFDVVGTHGAHDMWVVKTNSVGTAQWTRCLGGSDADDGIEIKQQADGTILAVGYTGSTDGNVTSLHGLHDIWITALDTSGSLLWQKTLGGSNYDYPRNLQIISTGQYIVAGKSNSNDGDVTVNHGGYDCWIVKLNAACISNYYADADGDGFGNPNVFTASCSQPSAFVNNNTDCNDGNPSIHPGANEVCNGLDDNCNAITDDGLTFITYFTDVDHDNYGLSSDPGTSMCNDPGIGYSTINTDCNDGDATVHPNVTDVCENFIDDNCNGQIDENCATVSYYADNDGDSYGNANYTITSAGAAPAGFVIDSTDCNDNDPSVHLPQLFYVDTDEDGFGSISSAMLCSSIAISGYSFNQADCNDDDPLVNPDATEVCNGIDDNCNGIIDDGVRVTFYADVDGDGYGSAVDSVLDCIAPLGYVINNTDCDDGNNFINPNAEEVCNGVDDNCNSQADEVCDLDEDGYSILQGDCNDNNSAIYPGSIEVCNGVDDNCDGSLDEGCDQDGDGYSVAQGDCNDNNPAIYPNAPEACNNIDDNCNNQIDEGVKTTFFADADGDGYGNALVTTQACSVPSGYVADQSDCDDSQPGIHPNATEACNNVDDNCNNQIDEGVKTTFYADADGDGYGNSLSTTQACSLPGGYVADQSDCDDSQSGIHPNATETCNNVDDNCNSQTDEGVKTTFYADADGDGYGNVAVTTQACSAPSGYVADQSDCDDSHSTVHPGAAEVCNSIDDNCNSQIDEGAVSATITPSGSVGICSGTTITLYASAGTGYTYQWKKNGSNISGATASNYNTKIAASFTVTISSGSCSVTSPATIISVNSLPAATITPSGTVSVCPGISLSMDAHTGNGLTYQWQKSGVNISGAVGSNYTTPVTGTYKVVVTNSSGCSKTSAVTTFNNYAAASVKISSTGNLNICSTGSVALSAKVVSDYTYQWFKNNAAISGATGTSYTATQAGTYYYQATTPHGCSANSGNKVVTGCRLENENDKSFALSIYPNPTDGNFNIELHLEGGLNATAKIELINLMGDIMLAENAEVIDGTLIHSVMVNNKLPGALYFVKITVEDQVFFQRIIYQR